MTKYDPLLDEYAPKAAEQSKARQAQQKALEAEPLSEAALREQVARLAAAHGLKKRRGKS